MEEPEKKTDNPIWIPKGDGLGWTLNFDNKWSYAVVAAFIIVIVGVIYWSSIQKS